MHGEIFKTFEEALRCNTHDVLKKAASENPKMLASISKLPPEIADKLLKQHHELIDTMYEQETDCIVHWIVHNLDVLETAISVYVDGKTQQAKASEEQAKSTPSA